MSRAWGFIVIALGALSCSLFFVAGYQLAEFGSELTLLRSRGGETVAEAYYQRIGHFGIAYARISYALGIFAFAISMGVGCMLLGRQQPTDASA